MTIYLAGKISGDPGYREKFEAAAARLRESLDVGVINPATLPAGMSNADYMAICLPMLLRADLAVFLPDWRDSPGAYLEHALCLYVGKPVMVLEE